MNEVNTIEARDVVAETSEALVSAGKSLIDLLSVSTVTVAHTTELSARAAVITVDTLDYGLRVALEVMPKNGKEAVDSVSSLFDQPKVDDADVESVVEQVMDAVEKSQATK